MKSIALFTLFTFASLISFGQQSEATSTDEKKEMKQATRIEQSQRVETPQATNNSAAKKKGPYLGREEKIKHIMKDGKIPASFPKFEEGSSYEEYKVVVFAWLRDNKDLVKEEEYTKFEQKL